MRARCEGLTEDQANETLKLNVLRMLCSGGDLDESRALYYWGMLCSGGDLDESRALYYWDEHAFGILNVMLEAVEDYYAHHPAAD